MFLMPAEVEIKFRVTSITDLEKALTSVGFHQQTPPTFEKNVLYDNESGELKRRGDVLRIRRYGETWKLTHKRSKGTDARHKTREENETTIANGEQMDSILRGLGYLPNFVYEKVRAEWTDGTGEVVLDQTPIGVIAEIEGAPGWIDRTATALGIDQRQYLTSSYAALFFEWKMQTGSPAQNMTFEECNTLPPSL